MSRQKQERKVFLDYHRRVRMIKLLFEMRSLDVLLGTNADVYIRIIDRDGNKSEPIQLKGSIDHKNKFERNKIDEFDVGKSFFHRISPRELTQIYLKQVQLNH